MESNPFLIAASRFKGTEKLFLYFAINICLHKIFFWLFLCKTGLQDFIHSSKHRHAFL